MIADAADRRVFTEASTEVYIYCSDTTGRYITIALISVNSDFGTIDESLGSRYNPVFPKPQNFVQQATS